MPKFCLEGIEGDDAILPQGRLVPPGLLDRPSWSSSPADWYGLLPMHEMEDDDEGLDQDQQRHDGSEDGQHRVGSGSVKALDAIFEPHVEYLDLLQAGQDGCKGGE